jgi:hypothetical protein
MECFALRKGRCTALNVKKCEGSSCSFYKTEEQYKEGREKAIKRINSLDQVTKGHILETYYGGKLEVIK